MCPWTDADDGVTATLVLRLIDTAIGEINKWIAQDDVIAGSVGDEIEFNDAAGTSATDHYSRIWQFNGTDEHAINDAVTLPADEAFGDAVNE